MKKLIAVLLCVSMLLALCGCGKKEAENTEAAEQTEATEQTEEGFTPVIICDNEYCTIIQTSPVNGEGPYVDMAVRNKTEGTISCTMGDQLYVNDNRIIGHVYGGCDLGPGKYTFVKTDLNFYSNGPVSKVDCSISVTYDNNLSGVYAEKLEVFNELVTIHNSGDPVPEKYVKTDKEMAVIDNGDFRIIATRDKIEDSPYDYWMWIYFENNSDDYITFYPIDKVTMTSDIQDKVYELKYRGSGAIQSGQNSYTIEPGTGCYVKAHFDKVKINNYAVDINEVVTIHFPIRVAYGWDEPVWDINVGKVEGETYTLSFTRDQLVK